MTQYVAFDIEIVKILPFGIDDWKMHRPLGISCAATLKDGEEPIVWHGCTAEDEIAERMSVDELGRLVAYLEEAVGAGFTVLTWNGLGFDFDILAEESVQLERCKALALDHVDMMFHAFCELGYPMGLDRAAQGMGLPGKPAGMSGEMVPIYWGQGKREEVLAYITQDVRTTLSIAQESERRHQLRWISRSGRGQTLALHRGWLTVRTAIGLPEPDTSWMRRPWPREKFTGWLSGKR